MKNTSKIMILLGLFMVQFIYNDLLAQPILSLAEAKEIAVRNSYNTQMSQNQLDIVKNNTNLIKSGQKPTFGLSAGLNGELNNSRVQIFGRPEVAENYLAPSMTSSISAASQYLLYDGNSIKNQLRQNESSVSQAKLSALATRESIVYQVENIYINLLLLEEQKSILDESLKISSLRKKRAQYVYDYGQSNKLNFLNATVDLNRDSLDFIKFNQQIVSLKNNLNLLLNRDLNTAFNLDPESIINLNNLSNREAYIANCEANNIDLLIAQKDLEISSYEKAINDSNLKPKIYANASYGLNYLNDSEPSFIDYNIGDALSLGLSASWNISDGGRTKYLNENTTLKISNQQVTVNSIKDQIRANIYNTWGEYENAQKLYELEKLNVVATQENFDYAETQFEQGQINSVTFRTSQLSLLNAKVNMALAKYEVALYELDLNQLSGNLVK